jgi:hypothetical protein
MSMRWVDLDHAAPLTARTWLAHALLLGGVLSAAALLAVLQQVDARTTALESDATRMRLPRMAAAPLSGAGQALQREEIVAAQAAMGELALPWEPLFRALESVKSPGVKLLALEPDPRRRRLRITAEAASVEEMLNYVEALNQAPLLQDVFLQRQERDEAGRLKFSVEAIWLMSGASNGSTTRGKRAA